MEKDDLLDSFLKAEWIDFEEKKEDAIKKDEVLNKEENTEEEKPSKSSKDLLDELFPVEKNGNENANEEDDDEYEKLWFEDEWDYEAMKNFWALDKENEEQEDEYEKEDDIKWNFWDEDDIFWDEDWDEDWENDDLENEDWEDEWDWFLDDEKEKEEEERKLKSEIEKEESQKAWRSYKEKLTEWYIEEREKRLLTDASNVVKKRETVKYSLDEIWKWETKPSDRILMTNWRGYHALARLVNMVIKDNVDVFSKKDIYSDSYKDIKYENFRQDKIKMKKMPYSCYIDFWNISIRDFSEINLDDAKELLVSSLYEDQEIEEMGQTPDKFVKSAFFWKNKLFVLNNVGASYKKYTEITEAMIDRWDYNQILLWYDILDNKLLFSKIKDLIHYQAFGSSGAGKTETLKNIVLQYLAKNNCEVMVIDKGTDFDKFFQQAARISYKSSVESLNVSDVISFFTYVSINFSLRIKMFWVIKDLEQFNEMRELEWKPKMNYMLIVIDEFKVLRENLRSSGIEDFFLEQLSALVSKCRSFGIYVMIATQAPNAADGIPKVLQNNLQVRFTGKTDNTKLIGYLKNDAEAKFILQKNIIHHWDFILTTDNFETVVRWYYDLNDSLTDLISDWYVLGRWEEQKQELEMAWGSSRYSIALMDQYNLEFIEKTGCPLIMTDRFEEFGINLDKVMAIKGVTRLAVIVIINFLIDWVEDTINTLTNTNITPTTFNITNVINIAKVKEENSALLFIFILIDNIFKNHLADGIKTIKFGKSDLKGINWDDGSTEALDVLLLNIKETVLFYLNKMIGNIQ